jgi:hypothetical protein
MMASERTGGCCGLHRPGAAQHGHGEPAPLTVNQLTAAGAHHHDGYSTPTNPRMARRPRLVLLIQIRSGWCGRGGAVILFPAPDRPGHNQLLLPTDTESIYLI